MDTSRLPIWFRWLCLWMEYQSGWHTMSGRYVQLREGRSRPHGILKSVGMPAYQQALDLWEKIGEQHPELTSIPADILADKSEKGCRKASRMSRNYRFDRSRCYLPVASATNMMLVMSARGWAQLCQHLSSHPLPEAQALAENIRSELKLSSPRLMKHAGRTDSIVQGIRSEMDELAHSATGLLPPALAVSDSQSSEMMPDVSLDVSLPDSGAGSAFAEDLQYHDNRYAWVGATLRRTAVRFRCEAISMGEIRDLNRHRTGNKYCPLRPLGFYSSLDQLPKTDGAAAEQIEALRGLNDVGRGLSAKAHGLLADGDPSYIHWTLLGTQYLFEHLTTADKFIYEAELRTGIGSHFRYAKHLKDALGRWYAEFPATKGLVKEGDAEPE